MADRERRDITDEDGRLILKDDDNGSGSKDRATVALVDAKIDGLKELIRAEMGYLRERIEPIKDLLSDMARLKEQGDDHERRLRDIERDRKGDREWRRVSLPVIVLAAIAAIVSIVELLPHFH